MYKTCVSKQAIARQREIEEGLLEFMTHKSYEQITVSDLCQHIGIPRKAFYRYFSNKEGALYALIDHKLKDVFNDFFDRDVMTLSRDEMMEHFFSFWLKEKPLLDALSRNELSGILTQRAISFTISDEKVSFMISHWQGSIPAKKYKSVFIISGIIALVIQWHYNRFDKTPKQMAVVVAELLP